jgi:hypothetical protein
MVVFFSCAWRKEQINRRPADTIFFIPLNVF